MAEIYSTASDQEQEAQRAQGRTASYNPVVDETPVGIYERPPRSARSIIGIFLLLLILVILAYFLFQWWS